MKIGLIDLKKQHTPLENEIKVAFDRVLKSGMFILGDEVSSFETEIASYTNCKYGVGVASGTDALLLSLKAIGIERNDEVITTPFTFTATAEVVALLGARPVFCDIDPKTYNINPDEIETKITSKTKAILPVHLYGQSADMDLILQIAESHNLKVIEDAAQSIGGEYRRKKLGSLGTAGCISFFPTKNLSCLGDGGMVLTNDEEIRDRLQRLRLHGAREKYRYPTLGYNNRLDEIQAAFLRIKLKYLDGWNERRKEIAKAYDDSIADYVQTPYVEPHNLHTYHQYSIRTKKRDELQKYLKDNGVATAIHYPIPLHLQPAYSYLGYKEGDFKESESTSKEILSLPIYPELTDEEVDYVTETILKFFKSH